MMRTLVAGMVAVLVLNGAGTQTTVGAPAELQSGRYTCTIRAKLHCANSQQEFDIGFDSSAMSKIRREMGGKNIGICRLTFKKKPSGGLKGDIKCQPKK